MTRSFFLSAFPLSLVFALGGCLSGEDDKGTPPTIVSQSSDTSLVAGGTATFTVEATGDAPLEYQWVRNGTDTLAAGTDSTLVLANVRLSRNGSAYVCIVRNKAGVAVSDPMTLTVLADTVPETVPLTTKILVAGAQSNATHGSSIDLDDFTTHYAVQAQAMEADIDLIFAYSTAIGGGMGVYSPNSAKNGINGSDGFDFMQGFNNPNTTLIKAVVVSFNDITTKAQLDSLWSVATPVADGRLYVAAGTTFMARSNQNRVVLMRVQDLTVGESGTMSLQGSAKFQD